MCFIHQTSCTVAFLANMTIKYLIKKIYLYMKMTLSPLYLPMYPSVLLLTALLEWDWF